MALRKRKAKRAKFHHIKMEKIVKQINIKDEAWEVHENIGTVGIPFRLYSKERKKNLWVYDIRQNEYIICTWDGATVIKINKQDFIEKKKKDESFFGGFGRHVIGNNPFIKP